MDPRFLWKRVRSEPWLSTVGGGFLVLIIAKVLNVYLPDSEVRGTLGKIVTVLTAGVRVLAANWLAFGFLLLLVAVIRLFWRVSTHLHPHPWQFKGVTATVSTPSVTVGIHPLEVRMLAQMKREGGGPFALDKLLQMLRLESPVEGQRATGCSHLHNVIALGFVSVHYVKSERAVSAINMVETLKMTLAGQAPPMKTEEYSIPYFSLTEKGRYALDHLESLPNEFGT